jgi:hypothetical protein
MPSCLKSLWCIVSDNVSAMEQFSILQLTATTKAVNFFSSIVRQQIPPNGKTKHFTTEAAGHFSGASATESRRRSFCGEWKITQKRAARFLRTASNYSLNEIVAKNNRFGLLLFWDPPWQGHQGALYKHYCLRHSLNKDTHLDLGSCPYTYSR